MSKAFEELTEVMERLRAPGGCPWDAEQTYQSLSRYLLEEAYETFDAIHQAGESGSTDELVEELGDLLLQVVFHSTIGKERNDFTIDDVAAGVKKKLILRHPHVFGDAKLEKAQDVLDNWEELKANERKASGREKKSGDSILDEVPIHFPGLLEGLKISEKAAKVGFDWNNTDDVFEKIDEEITEIRGAISGQSGKEKIEEEVGDLLFSVVNLARKLGVEPETAMKHANRKFRKRFSWVEGELRMRGKSFNDSNIEEMDGIWQTVKKRGN